MRKRILSVAVFALVLSITLSAVMPSFAGAASTLLTASQGNTIANEAEKYDWRVRYNSGGYTNPSEGLDSTGFVKYVFAQHDINVPYNMSELARSGQYVSYSNLQAGDVLFFGSSASNLSVVAIYKGNGNFIGSSSYYGGVVEKRLSDFRGSYVGARRMHQAGQSAQPVQQPEEQAPVVQQPAPQEPVVQPEPQQPVSNTSAYGDKIVAESRKYLGVPYVFGSSASTTTSFDCSSFVQRSVYDAGLGKLPRTARAQARYMAEHGKAVTRSELKPGDILFWKNMGTHVPAGTVSHVGIYIGDNKIIQAMPNKGVIISTLTSYYTSPNRVAGAYRIVKPVS